MTVENDTYRQPFMLTTLGPPHNRVEAEIPLASHRHDDWPKFQIRVHEDHARVEFATYWANSGAACSHAELVALRDALTAIIDETGIGDAA